MGKNYQSSKKCSIWVPPSVVVPGVLAFNDAVAAPWYAPAGLNRGGLTQLLIHIKHCLNQIEIHCMKLALILLQTSLTKE
jgi:hypothetical protein